MNSICPQTIFSFIFQVEIKKLQLYLDQKSKYKNVAEIFSEFYF